MKLALALAFASAIAFPAIASAQDIAAVARLQGEAILAAGNFVPSNRNVPTPFGDRAIRFIDAAEALDKQQAWTRTYEDTFVKRAR